MNLTVCADSKVMLGIPVSFDDNKLFKQDSNSDFYNDILFIYLENGLDVTLDKRKKELVENNLTLCEENCDFKRYNSKTKKSLCSYQIKIKLPLISEISFNKDEI